MKLDSSCVVGTEVGFSLAHSNPFFSLDPGSLEHLTLSPRAVIGPGARFVEFFHTGIPRRRRTEREVAGRNSVTPAGARNCSTGPRRRPSDRRDRGDPFATIRWRQRALAGPSRVSWQPWGRTHRGWGAARVRR